MHGGRHNDHPPTGTAEQSIQHIIKQLHLKLKEDYTVRWELDRYLLALHYSKEAHTLADSWLILDISDTYHYYNLPDLANIIRHTFMGKCCASWLQKLFNMFLCGKRYRRLITASQTTCQLTAAVINTLHGLLLGLYPFNERRMDIEKRAWLAGTLREVLTGDAHMSFIESHPYLICMGLAEYIINVIDDFCPVEWTLLGVTPSGKSQCMAAFESFREEWVSPLANTPEFWTKLEEESQPVVSSLVKFFRDASFYQHKPQTILPQSIVQHLPLALGSRIIQNTRSMFGQLKASMPAIQFQESEALEGIWSSMYIRALPTHTTGKQIETLTAMGKMCCLVEEELHHFPICTACALTKRMDVLKGMFRYDDIACRLVCNECVRHQHVVNVNMLGRVLYIRDKTIVLCEKCLSPKYWDAVCTCLTDETAPQRICCACQNMNIVSTKEIVDIHAVEMKSIHFCYKHSLSCVLNQATVYDIKSLEKELQARHQQSSSAAVMYSSRIKKR